MGAADTVLRAAVRAAAAGEYDVALAGCREVRSAWAAGPGQRDCAVEQASLALSLEGSLWRQLGDPETAVHADLRALELVWAAPTPDRLCENDSCSDRRHRVRADAEGDATANLVADAVAAGDLTAAHGRAAAAVDAVAGSAHEPGAWRREVRLGWVLAESALLAGDLDDAVEQAGRALARSRTGRHAAKSRLVLGVAERARGDRSAPGRLAAAYDASVRLGLAPLVVVAGSALLTVPDEGWSGPPRGVGGRHDVAVQVSAAAEHVRRHLPVGVAAGVGWWSVAT